MFNKFIAQIMDCHVDNESYTGMDWIFIIIGGKAIHMDILTVLDVAVITITAFYFHPKLVITARITKIIKILALLCVSIRI